MDLGSSSIKRFSGKEPFIHQKQQMNFSIQLSRIPYGKISIDSLMKSDMTV